MTQKNKSIIQMIISQAIQIQKIPSLTFDEKARAAYLLKEFITNKLEDVHQDELGNVYGKVKGGKALPIIVTAHLDTVLSSATTTPLKIEENQLIGSGIGDNSLGLAALLGMIHLLKTQPQPLPGDIWLVANVCEEGLGNLRGIKKVVERFKDQVTTYIALEGIGIGFIQTSALGIHRFKIEVSTSGGHAWVNFGDPSAIHELAKISTRIIKARLPKRTRCSINVGTIEGGDSINTIASHAEMQVEIRAENTKILERLKARINRLAHKEDKEGIEIKITDIGSRPSGKISQEHKLIRTAQEALICQGIPAVLAVSSSDASWPMSLGYPATCLGLTTGKNIHTQQESIDLLPITKGIHQVLYVLEHIW